MAEEVNNANPGIERRAAAVDRDGSGDNSRGDGYKPPGQDAPTRLLSMDELSEWLQVPKQTVYKWRCLGVGPRGYRLGKHVRFHPADVEQWLATQREEAD